MKLNKLKRALSAVLSMSLCLGMLSTAAFASPGWPPQGGGNPQQGGNPAPSSTPDAQDYVYVYINVMPDKVTENEADDSDMPTFNADGTDAALKDADAAASQAVEDFDAQASAPVFDEAGKLTTDVKNAEDNVKKELDELKETENPEYSTTPAEAETPSGSEGDATEAQAENPDAANTEAPNADFANGVNGDVEKLNQAVSSAEGTASAAKTEADSKFSDLQTKKAELDNGHEALGALPDQYIAFQCAGWFCGEDGAVCQLILEEPGYGRRELAAVDGDTARALVLDGAEYLAGLVGEDGAISAASGEVLDAPGHAEVLSALIQGYGLKPDEALGGSIDRAASRLLAGIAYTDGGPAYVPDGGEITLESCALSLIALADCMEASGNTAYLPACEALGAGILSLLDTETGAFFQVLDAADLGRKEAFRSAAWDGMGITALCRLYGLTENSLWLWAARLALDRMSAEDYAQHADPWTSYAVRELTAHEQSQADYYVFALTNAQRNLTAIYSSQTASPAGLELLMASYEAYRQMTAAGYSAGGFELELMLQVICARAARQIDGYMFPEYAMYMDKPQEVLGAFMTREEGLSISPREVCRNIRGYGMYAENYDALVSDGMPVTG